MFAGTVTPTYFFGGLGQDTTQEWIDEIIGPIAEAVNKYYQLQQQQASPTQIKQTLQTPFLSSTSMLAMILIGGGLLIWLMKSGGSKSNGYQRRRKKNRSRRRRR